MRILHLSHGALPDLRIEKTALTMKKEGNETAFLGGRKSKFQNLGAFDHVEYLPMGNDLDVALNPLVERRWLKRIRALKPDVVHAHNILVGRIMLRSGIPTIYDDHEYWSKQVFKYAERRLPRGLASRPLMHRIPMWEKEVLQSFPTITTNENIAKEHRRLCKWVGVTKNVPTLKQVENLPNPANREGLVYVGTDFDLPQFHPHRNMRGLRGILKFDVVSGMPHREMMESITKYRIGLTPWIPHPWHPYSEANRNYEYLHAGLQVVVNQEIKLSFLEDPYVHAFTDYSDIKQAVQEIPDINPIDIVQHARERYIWEKQEHVIREAYRMV